MIPTLLQKMEEEKIKPKKKEESTVAQVTPKLETSSNEGSEQLIQMIKAQQEQMKNQQEQTKIFQETLKQMKEQNKQNKQEFREFRNEIKKTQNDIQTDLEKSKLENKASLSSVLSEMEKLLMSRAEPSGAQKKTSLERRIQEKPTPMTFSDPRERDPTKPRHSEAVRRIRAVCKNGSRDEYRKMIEKIVSELEEAIEKIKENNRTLFLFRATRQEKRPTQKPCQYFQINDCKTKPALGVHTDHRKKEIFCHICEICQYIRFGNLEHDLTQCELLREIDEIEMGNPSYKPYFILDNFFLDAEQNNQETESESQANTEKEQDGKATCGTILPMIQ